MSINVLAICGSLRAKSTNRGLLRYAQAHAPDGMKIHLADLLDVPFYNADLAEKPAAVKQLLKQIGEADAEDKKFASLMNDQNIGTITLAEALQLFFKSFKLQLTTKTNLIKR